MTLLNAAVADGLSDLIESIKQKKKASKPMDAIVLEVISETIQETKPIRFEGNNYSPAWVDEAEKRGLLNLRKTPEALAQLVTDQSKEMLVSLGIFREAELVSRFHVRLERYLKNLQIEVDTLRAILDTQVFPSAFAYHHVLSQGVIASQTLGFPAPQMGILSRLNEILNPLQKKRIELETIVQKVESMGNQEEKAKGYAFQVSTVMMEIRALADELEAVVADDAWPLPKYREMLFLA
jgi:glutamine synthetase